MMLLLKCKTRNILQRSEVLTTNEYINYFWEIFSTFVFLSTQVQSETPSENA